MIPTSPQRQAPISIGTHNGEVPPLDHPEPAQQPEVAHRVALAWVFDPSRTSILLVEHPTMGWSCPGGHLEPGELPTRAARRELEEETGLTLHPVTPDPLTIFRSFGCPRYGPDTIHWAIGYEFCSEPTTPLTTEHGQRARWFRRNDLPATRTPDIDTVLTSISQF